MGVVVRRATVGADPAFQLVGPALCIDKLGEERQALALALTARGGQLLPVTQLLRIEDIRISHLPEEITGIRNADWDPVLGADDNTYRCHLFTLQP